MGGLIGGIFSSNATENAAQTAANATEAGQQIQQNMFNKTQQNLQPFVNSGQSAYTNLAGQIPQLTQNFSSVSGQANPFAYNSNLTPQNQQAWLEQTPGYQFTQQQGLESTQNGYAARGLASSGAAMKGAANYATGLANNTYSQQLNNYLAQMQGYLGQNLQNFNIQNAYAGTGEAAAAGLAGNTQATGASIAQSSQNAGQLLGAGMSAAGNTLGSSLANFGTSYNNFANPNSPSGGLYNTLFGSSPISSDSGDTNYGGDASWGG